MRVRFLGMSAVLVAVVALCGSAASAAEWGTLKGKFVYDGKAPTPKTITPDKDTAVCGKHKLVDESLIVGPTGGLKDVVIYLRTDKPVAVHPDYEKSAKDEKVLDNRNCHFEPHVLLLQTTQTLKVKNSDPVGHNTNIAPLNNAPINPLIAAGGSIDAAMEKAERQPIGVSCNIHPWMKAYLLVRDDPYMAISNEEGVLEIKDLPVGTHEFVVWHEPGFLKNIKIGGQEPKKGRVKLTVKAGMNDLGTIKVSPDSIVK